MKIKEVEYRELQTSHFNNYVIGLKAEIDEGENFKEVLLSLKQMVREELEKAIGDQAC